MVRRVATSRSSGWRAGSSSCSSLAAGGAGRPGHLAGLVRQQPRVGPRHADGRRHRDHRRRQHSVAALHGSAAPRTDRRLAGLAGHLDPTHPHGPAASLRRPAAVNQPTRARWRSCLTAPTMSSFADLRRRADETGTIARPTLTAAVLRVGGARDRHAAARDPPRRRDDPPAAAAVPDPGPAHRARRRRRDAPGDRAPAVAGRHLGRLRAQRQRRHPAAARRARRRRHRTALRRDGAAARLSLRRTRRPDRAASTSGGRWPRSRPRVLVRPFQARGEAPVATGSAPR